MSNDAFCLAVFSLLTLPEDLIPLHMQRKTMIQAPSKARASFHRYTSFPSSILSDISSTSRLGDRKHADIPITAKRVLKDHPIGHKNGVCQDRWCLVIGSVILQYRSVCQKMCGMSRQVVSHGSGLSGKVSLYQLTK